MLLIDVNVLVYAYRQGAPEHKSYLQWLEGCINSDQPFGLAELVLSGFLRIATRLCRAANAKGNLIPDAYLAALAIESGTEWITADRDFSRFPGLQWRHPLD